MTASREPDGPWTGSVQRFVPIAVSILAIVVAVGLITLAPGGDETAEATRPAAPLDLSSMTPDEAERRAPELVTWALTGIYAAFGQDTDSAIDERLSAVATGEALQSLFLDSRPDLADHGLDTADRELHELEIISVEPRRDGDTISAVARWRVLGIVDEVAHVHVRGNAYLAEIAFTRIEDGWRVTDFVLEDVDRSGNGTIVDDNVSN